MKKIIFFFYLIFNLFFFTINSNSSVFDEKKKNIEIFGKILKIGTSISFSKNDEIYWLNNFEKVSETENLSTYELENNKIKIIRYLKKYNNKINIEDHYINKTSNTIGVITNYEFFKFLPTSTKISGSDIEVSNKILAENPTIILKNDKKTLGIYINDQFSKIHSKISINKDKNLNISNDNLIIKPKDKYIKSFTIYKFNKVISYYDFINFLRKELNVYSYLDGNLFWLDTYKNRNILSDETRLKNFLKNYGVKYLLITPWLDYDNYNFSKNEKWNRKEFKNYLIKIRKKIKKINPEIKLILALQSNVVNINEKIQDIVRENKLNEIKNGFHHYYLDVKYLLNLGIKKEEIVFDKSNRILFETYYHDWKYNNTENIEEIALALKAYNDGFLFNKLIEQVNFTIDEVEYDGVYIDQFNQHYISPNHKKSYDGYNVNVGEIDHLTGKIIKLSENITLNTSEFKKKIIDYTLTKTNFIFLNSHHLDDDLRKKPVVKFFEGFWYFWAEKMWKENSRDFFSAKTYFSSHLSTPVSLSLSFIQPGDWQSNPHDALVKNLRFCLYNGNLIYLLAQDIKKLDTAENKTNVFSKLYPIKIEKIYQGKIVGKDKIITIKDIQISEKDNDNFNFYYFDKKGYLKKNKLKKLTKIKNKIIVHVEKDEILILEKKNF